MAKNRVRKTFDIPTDEVEQLSRHSADAGVTQCELARRALRQYFKSEEYKEKGYSPGVHRIDQNGDIKIVEFLF